LVLIWLILEIVINIGAKIFLIVKNCIIGGEKTSERFKKDGHHFESKKKPAPDVSGVSSGYQSGIIFDSSVNVTSKSMCNEFKNENVFDKMKIEKLKAQAVERERSGLKRCYGEFYCRECDRSWSSDNVWVTESTETTL